MKNLKQSYTINAPVSKVWQALIDIGDIEEWGAGPAVMDDKVGTHFKLWGGDIHGQNLEVVPEKQLKQEWYGGEWPQPSHVTFHLSKVPEGTKLELIHENIPDEAYIDIANGWKQYYIGPLKEFVEET